MRVLVACEFSGIVRDAFIAGHPRTHSEHRQEEALDFVRSLVQGQAG